MASVGLLPKYVVLVAIAALCLALVGLGSRGGLAVFTGQAANTGNSLSTASCFSGDTGFLDPAAEAADTGGDGNGFELNPTNAFADGGGYATNNDGDQDRHSFYDYGISFGAACVVTGIEVRLDWWLDDTAGDNESKVILSWDGGSTWTSVKKDTQETTSEHTAVLGSSSDTWGRTWTATELSDANFRLNIKSESTDSSRDFFLDWVPMKVFYGTP